MRQQCHNQIACLKDTDYARAHPCLGERELLRGDLWKAIQQLKRESGRGLFMGVVKLSLALAG